MQLKFFIKNFDQYDFLLPLTNRYNLLPGVIRATLQAKAFYHLSRKQLENFFTKFQYIQDDEISLKTSTTTQSANSKPQGTLMKGDSSPLMYVEIHSYWVSRGD